MKFDPNAGGQDRISHRDSHKRSFVRKPPTNLQLGYRVQGGILLKISNPQSGAYRSVRRGASAKARFRVELDRFEILRLKFYLFSFF